MYTTACAGAGATARRRPLKWNERGRVERRADVRRLPFADATFDAVVSLSTLDHFDLHTDIETSLAELVRVLRPGGTLILTLDNLANPIIALRAVLPFRLLQAAGVVPYEIGRTCGPRRLGRFVTRAGLEVVETSTR
jgi:ubiquinone/menaquinone biosynthesis C-methylase UbiE